MNHHAMLAHEPTPGLTSAGCDPPSGVHRRRPSEDAAHDGCSALVAFITHGAPSVAQIAFRFRVSAGEAEEIRQDTFEAMVKSAELIQAPLAWFWETARRRHCRLDRRKGLDRRAQPTLRELAEQRRSSFPAPDAAITLREQGQAVERMLEHVKPSRRAVAALRLAGDNEKEIQAKVHKPVGTVRSMWTRAKEDAGPYWRAVVALVTALLLWLAKGWRRGVGSPAIGRQARAGSGASAGQFAAGAGDARRGGLAAFLACALPLAITNHVGPESPLLADTRPFEEAAVATSAAGWGAVAASPRPATPPEREDTTPSPPPDPVPTTPQHHKLKGAVARSAASGQSTNEKPSPGRGAVTGGTSGRDPALSSSPGSESSLATARAHLAAVHRAIWVQRNRDTALALLKLYDLTYPDNPWPGKRAELARVLRVP